MFVLLAAGGVSEHMGGECAAFGLRVDGVKCWEGVVCPRYINDYVYSRRNNLCP